MRIAVAGGTGTVGREVVHELRGRGHDVRGLSRSSPDWPVDLTTGQGLDAALEGVDVVVDASNGPSPGRAAAVLVEGTTQLLAAEARAGVGHHVCVSIVGIDRTPLSLYRVKVQQERAVVAGDVPWTIVRCTQFHGLVAQLLGAGAKVGVVPSGRARLQPVAAADAGRAVADVAEQAPRRGRVEVAGPQAVALAELAQDWRAARGGLVRVPLPLPPRLGRALRAGSLTTADPGVRGATTFASWLAAGGAP
ncbi:SDR family oxidoreductase [Conexibacter sp. SYSU D00693]|uniref:SDR family oxidoreductase n=1 Tax=Conexibacter sp. SYSU D00693 TaxID=2812560 RepID=UPI00196A8D4E|nr:NAD(P)H-binding protein [Conexibacter sp. SYSU D00693]